MLRNDVFLLELQVWHACEIPHYFQMNGLKMSLKPHAREKQLVANVLKVSEQQRFQTHLILNHVDCNQVE